MTRLTLEQGKNLCCHACRLAAVGVFFLLIALTPLSAQPIKVVVPIPPGSSLDVMTRVLAEQIGRANGPAMIVENHPGADTIIGTELVAHAAPNGKTLLAAGPGVVLNPLLRKTNYDPLRSLAPVCHLAIMPTVIAVSSKSPYYTLADLLNAARIRPAQLTLASIGPASTAHLAFEQLKRAAKVDMTFVPYPGTAPAFEATVGGHVTAAWGDVSLVAPQVRAGALRALAAAAPTRLALLPDVPTLAELGFPEIGGELWFGIFAPANTLPEATDRLATLYADALQANDAQKKITNLGLYPRAFCGQDFAEFLRKQFEQYASIIRDAGIGRD